MIWVFCELLTAGGFNPCIDDVKNSIDSTRIISDCIEPTTSLPWDILLRCKGSQALGLIARFGPHTHTHSLLSLPNEHAPAALPLPVAVRVVFNCKQPFDSKGFVTVINFFRDSIEHCIPGSFFTVFRTTDDRSRRC